MDSFNEQLIKIKKSGTSLFCQIGIWTVAAIVCVVSLLLLKYTPLVLFLAAGALYGAYKLSGQLNIEYEYILTNGTVDIDKIINKSQRKRVLSFECRSVEEITKVKLPFKPTERTQIVCTDDFENAYSFTLTSEEKGRCKLIFSPNEKFIKGMKIFISRALSRELTD